MVNDDLETALRKISQIADIEALAQQNTSAEDVFNLYLKNDWLFRRVYSWAGSPSTSLLARMGVFIGTAVMCNREGSKPPCGLIRRGRC